MRKLGEFQISKPLIAANDNTPDNPAPDLAAPPALVPERPPVRTRDAPDPFRGGAHRAMKAHGRGHGPSVPLPRVLRPRRRS
jgi:hypothetical protein